MSSTSASVVGTDLVIIRRAQIDDDAAEPGAGSGANDMLALLLYANKLERAKA